MDTYIKQAWSLVNEYFHSNSIEPSKYVDHELVRAYLKACQKSTPKGIRVVTSGSRLYLRFKRATKATTANNSCNEDFTRDGCVNALAKAIAVSYKLKECETESEFWEWYQSEIKGTQTLVDDYLTIGQAIEAVKNQFFKDYDKVGRDRSDSSLDTNSKASYQEAYGVFHSKLNPELKLTADLSTGQKLQRVTGRGFDGNHHNIQQPSWNRLTNFELNYDLTWAGMGHDSPSSPCSSSPSFERKPLIWPS